MYYQKTLESSWSLILRVIPFFLRSNEALHIIKLFCHVRSSHDNRILSKKPKRNIQRKPQNIAKLLYNLNFLAMAFLVTEQFKCHSELQNMREKETERKK